MRLKGRQARFLAATLGGWIALRAWLLWPAALVPGASGPLGPAPRVAALVAPVAASARARRREIRAARVAPPRRSQPLDSIAPIMTADSSATVVARVEPARAPMPVSIERLVPFAPVAAGAGRAIEGQAYLFVRPGSGRATLAPGGSLGGSQVAARIAVALDRAGPIRVAAAARLYAPLHGLGAEAAVGLDWHPLPHVPLRVSVERRIALDRAGRDAWSAYAAGGFYAGHLPLGLEADGYAQAGLVGTQRLDRFVDGALRLGRRLPLGKADLVLGAGGWGAAQPGAARLDLGPRAALSLPVERHRLTLAVEGRMRVAGRAAPGSGAALTLAADF